MIDEIFSCLELGLGSVINSVSESKGADEVSVDRYYGDISLSDISLEALQKDSQQYRAGTHDSIHPSIPPCLSPFIYLSKH